MQLATARAIVDDVVEHAAGPVSVYVAAAHGELVAATRELAEKARADPVERASFDPFFTFLHGGVAVFENGRRVGAGGVSGQPGEVDEALALAAIERVVPGGDRS